jgi:phospholipid transport system substrate-binding protein
MNTPTPRRSILAVVAVCTALTAAQTGAFAPRALAMGTGGMEAVRTLYNTLLWTMRNGPSLGPRGRYAQIEPTIRRVFDIPFMSRLAVGPEWASLTVAQQQQVSQAFERYVTAVYAERFDSYSGERLQVTGEQPSTGGVIITSQIVKSNGEPVNINYLMRQNGGAWQIADVYLDGTISELATRRSEFAAILRTRGINGLIETLNAKANSLAASRTS